MVDKKYLTRKKKANTYLFSPRITEEEVAHRVLGDVVDRVFDGSTSAVLLKAEVFNGEARWLEISVACPCGGAPVKLSPRQPVTPVPYSLQTRGLFVDDAGHVGIGND